MKKLLTCLFTLLMAVAILSPVRMSADSIEVDVTFTTSDPDFYVLADDVTIEVAEGNQSLFPGEVEKLLLSKEQMIAYDGDLEYVDKFLTGVDVSYEIYIRNNKGTRSVVSGVWGVDGIGTALDNLKDGDLVIVEFAPKIDCYSVGDLYDAESVAKPNADGTDDRKQEIATIKTETWSDLNDKGTGKYATYNFVYDGKEATLKKLIENLDEFTESHRVGSGKDRKTYRLVFDINGDKAVGEWDVRPYVDEDRYGAVTPETPENTLDKDGDGIVTCDEYYGVTGLKWDDKKNACVLRIGLFICL